MGRWPGGVHQLMLAIERRAGPGHPCTGLFRPVAVAGNRGTYSTDDLGDICLICPLMFAFVGFLGVTEA